MSSSEWQWSKLSVGYRHGAEHSMKHEPPRSQRDNWAAPLVGRPKVVTPEYLSTLKVMVQYGPQHYGYPFKRWTASWLGRHLATELGIQVSDRHINRLLKEMGLSNQRRGSM